MTRNLFNLFAPSSGQYSLPRTTPRIYGCTARLSSHGIQKPRPGPPVAQFSATAGLEKAPEFLTVDWLLSQLGRRRSQAQARYRQFVREGLGDRPWEKLRGQIYLGSEEFLRKQAEKDRSELAEVPRVQRRAVRPSLEQIVRQKGERSIASAYREHGYRLKEIAQYLRVHYSTVSRRLKELEEWR